MKQVIRRGLKEIIVDEVADPKPSKITLWVSVYSLINNGTEYEKQGVDYPVVFVRQTTRPTRSAITNPFAKSKLQMSERLSKIGLFGAENLAKWAHLSALQEVSGH